MDRETLKLIAAGHFALGKATIDKSELQTFVDGSMLAFDMINKVKIKEKIKDETQKTNVLRNNPTTESLEN